MLRGENIWLLAHLGLLPAHTVDASLFKGPFTEINYLYHERTRNFNSYRANQVRLKRRYRIMNTSAKGRLEPSFC